MDWTTNKLSAKACNNFKKTNKAKTKEIAKRKIQQQQKDENKKLKKKTQKTTRAERLWGKRRHRRHRPKTRPETKILDFLYLT